MVAPVNVTATTTGNVTDLLATTGIDIQSAVSSGDAFFSDSFQAVHNAFATGTGIDPDAVSTSTHFSGTLTSTDGTFDIKGSKLGAETGTSSITSITYTENGSTFTVSGKLVYDNVTETFLDTSIITSVSVTTSAGTHSYAGKDLGLDFSFNDSEIAFVSGTVSSEVIQTAASKVTLNGAYAGVDDAGSVSSIVIEDPSSSANKVTLTGGFDAPTLISTLDDIGTGHLSDFFSTDAAPLFTGSDTITATGTLGIHGFAGNDVMNGGSGADTLFGDDGNDTLDGGKGADTMTGGDGNDVYYVDNLDDVVVEGTFNGSSAPNVGTDTVHATVSGYVLADNVENLILDGKTVAGAGNALNNVLTGNAANNVLDGMGGDDSMDGGAGNDTYYMDNASDVIIDSAGTDTVHVAFNGYTLSANLENGVIDGHSDFNITGNASKNILTGNDGNNTLDGGAGADSMIGGEGNDTYVVDDAGDKVVEAGGEGNDTVISTINYTLGTNVEALVLHGTATQGTGNADDNFIQGGDTGISYNLKGMAGDDLLIGSNLGDLLDGGADRDSMVGGLGNDTYIVDNSDDTVVENMGEGTDTVMSSVSYTLGDGVENLVLTGKDNINGAGNLLVNIITGNDGNNVLDGGGIDDTLFGSHDTLDGGKGNDTYLLRGGDEVILDSAGNDTISLINYTGTETSWTLDAGVIENLTLGGTVHNGTGNDAVNILTGTTGDDVLNGMAGADTMIGDDGDDTYSVDNTGDKIIDTAGLADTVNATISYTLGNGLENLNLSGAAVKFGTGNLADNIIDAHLMTTAVTLSGKDGVDTLIGGTGNDTLDGGAGVDTMTGGAGNDTYIVDDSGDKVVEASGAGTDTVMSSAISYTLAANVENLVLTGSSNINGTGNALDNTITGNSGDNLLAGGGGTDTLIGGAGNDTYLYTGTETIIDSSGKQDLVVLGANYDLSVNPNNFSGIEGLVLQAGVSTALTVTGDSGTNFLAGNEFDNVLNGREGADTMIGGAGNDTYVVDNTKDLVIENSGEGTADAIFSGVSYTLGDNIENLTLISTSSATTATGNALDNVITALSTANHTIDGGVGADSMHGGTGNDTYYVDNSGDVVTDDGGTKDLVISSINYVLGTSGIENLTLTGSGNLNGTGSTDTNVITGNDGNNVLDGMGIADIAQAQDTLIGGKGDDTYLLRTGLEVLKETSGVDTIDLTNYTGTGTSWTLASGFENLALGGTVHSGIGNSSNNVITSGTGDDTLDGMAGADLMNGGGGNDTYFVDNVDDSIVDSSGTDVVHSTVSYTLAAGLENLFLDGKAAINGTGNAGANIITGNDGANTLDGGAGNSTLDTLIGGLGNDTYIVHASGDVVSEAAGAGTDTVASDSIDLNISSYQNVENLTLLAGGHTATGDAGVNVLTGSTGNDKLFGMGGNDILIGNDGDDTLDGGTGNDSMTGGAGNDNYYVDATGDKIVESSGTGSGVDTVHSTINYTLGTNLENLELLAGAADALIGTGNAVANTLQGNEFDNTLDGKAGADQMIGGDGNDTYYVDNALDSIIETSGVGSGIDVEYVSVTATIAANVETLIMTGSADLTATGSAGADSLVGNSGDNVFISGGGADHFEGGMGNDTYHYTGIETIVEAAKGGTDTVMADGTLTSIDLTDTVHFANIENASGALDTVNYTLSGNEGINVLTGAGGNDVLHGGDGNDSLIGGAGNDTLDGGLGNDKMLGGLGDDLYFVDSKSDKITENSGEGHDVVHSSITYTLGSNLEDLYLDGSANINGTGNALNNYLEGNTGNNTLNGGAGDDMIYGHGGADKLTGGAGNDTFFFAHGDTGVAAITDFTHSATGTGAHDVIDIADILSNGTDYVDGVSNINDYVHLTFDGKTATLSIDADGAGAGTTQLQVVTFTLADQTLTAHDLVTHNELVVSHLG